MYGPVKLNELWRIRRNDELEDIIKLLAPELYIYIFLILAHPVNNM